MTDPRSLSRRFSAYLMERSPLPLLLAIALPQALSSHWLLRSGAPSVATWVAAVALMLVLVNLRMMDEVKDEAKDRVAHPERPIPRGLITADELRRGIFVLSVGLTTYGVIGWREFSLPFGWLVLITDFWALLMYREFFAPVALAKSPMAYALSHQLIVVFMYLLAVAAAEPGAVLSSRALWWAFGGLGGSFVVEVSRKLDPSSHPVLKTYLWQYGAIRVALLMLAALGLIGVAAWQLHYHMVVLPFVGLAAVAVVVWLRRLNQFKLVEALTGLTSLVYMLAPTIAYAWSLR